jgi:hypothetical protein
MQTKSAGITRVLQSAAAGRRQHGLCGRPESDDQAYAYLKKRTHWMRYRQCRSQGLPSGSGITEAACKLVCTQRRKCSGMSWTREGGPVIVDLRVVWLRGVWSEVHQRYVASKPMPDSQADRVTGTQHEQQAA